MHGMSTRYPTRRSMTLGLGSLVTCPWPASAQERPAGAPEKRADGSPVTTAEAAALDPARLLALVEWLDALRSSNVHSVLIVRAGQLAFEPTAGGAIGIGRRLYRTQRTDPTCYMTCEPSRKASPRCLWFVFRERLPPWRTRPRCSVIYGDDGQLLTASFMDYFMPRATDLPTLSVHHHVVPARPIRLA